MKIKRDLKFVEVTEEDKRIFLDALGYEVNEEGLVLLKGTKEPYICPITKEEVRIENASIVPFNSIIVMNTDVLSISEYLSLLPRKKRD